MSEHRSGHLVGVIVALVVAAVVFIGVVLLVRTSAGLGYEPPATASTTGAKLALSVFPDSYPCHGSTRARPGAAPRLEWVTYCPSTSIKVPAYSTVTVTVKQYDTSTALHNPFFDKVAGRSAASCTSTAGRCGRSVPTHRATRSRSRRRPNANETQLFVNVRCRRVEQRAEPP